MTLRVCLRLILLATLLLAPMGRMAAARAMAGPVPAGAAMTGHCAGMPAAAPAPHQRGHRQGAPHEERVAVDCMIACAAMACASAPIPAPPPSPAALPGMLLLSSLTGIRPEADPPPPRRS